MSALRPMMSSKLITTWCERAEREAFSFTSREAFFKMTAEADLFHLMPCGLQKTSKINGTLSQQSVDTDVMFIFILANS